jgi:cytochrome P450
MVSQEIILTELYAESSIGEIFKLNLGGQEKLFITTAALLNEICDEKRFTKLVTGNLNQVRNGIADGLFTAHSHEHNWGVAHRVLMSAFGPMSIRLMFDEMHDIATQLVAKWARFGSKEKINVTDDFTRLTLDSIALYVPQYIRTDRLINTGVQWIPGLTASITKICTHLSTL